MGLVSVLYDVVGHLQVVGSDHRTAEGGVWVGRGHVAVGWKVLQIH